jgi:hypothetical protein
MPTREQKLEAKKRYYQKNKSKINQECKENNSRLRLEKKKFIIETLGSKCCNCGNTNLLEIDHINPGLKKDRKCLYACSWDRIKIEIHNLQLLCNTCHFERSQLQKHTSWYYFKNLPLEEQNRLMKQYQKEGSTLPSWEPNI